MSDKLPNKREYSTEVLAQVGSYAQNGSTPSQLATLLQLAGVSRANFIEDICHIGHPLYVVYRHNLQINNDDIDSTLNRLSLAGDTDAMDIVLKRETRDYIAELKQDLFGL